MRKIIALAATATVLAAAPAHAHSLTAAGAGLAAGAAHPLLGFDHLLAMLAVGLWAGQSGGRSCWIVPAAFVSTMVAGAGLGMAGVALPMVEAGIAASVLVLGLLILTARRLPLAGGVALVGAFALFHGHAHGTELPAAADIAAYAAGFVAVTAALHILGLALGTALRRDWATRAVGAGITAAGLALSVI